MKYPDLRPKKTDPKEFDLASLDNAPDDVPARPYFGRCMMCKRPVTGDEWCDHGEIFEYTPF